MSIWTDRVKGHSIWAVLHEFGPALDEAFKIREMDADSLSGLHRLKVGLEFTGKRLDAIDPHLIQVTQLDSIAGYFREAKANVDQFLSTKSFEQIKAANDQLDVALTNLAQVNSPLTSDDIGGLREAADHYRESMERAGNSAAESVAELTRSANAVEAELEKLRTGIVAQTDELKTSCTAQLVALGVDIGVVKTRADGVISEFQSQFSTAQSSQITEFGNLITEWKGKLVEHERLLAQDRNGLRTEHETEAGIILERMKVHRTEIQSLVGVIANLGMTSGFQKAADAAKKSTRLWHGVTVGAIALLIAWLIFSLVPVVKSDNLLLTEISWPNLLVRLLVSIAFGVLAKYAATQADKYLRIQQVNRKLELELQAVGPYVEPLPVEDRNEFRLALAKRIFGRHEHSTGSIKSDRSPATVIDVLLSPEAREIFEKFGPQFQTALPDLIQLLQKFTMQK